MRNLFQGLPQGSYHHEGGVRMVQDIAINGDNAIALAWKQIDPDVCAAYPITPQTIIVEKFAEYVANAEVSTEFVCVESEHSALTLCTSSASAGARTFTATASQGLAYMWEMLPITAAMRVPLIMAVANRAVSGPININNDHGDAMAARDCGWLMLFSENVQEAYDMSIVAPKIAENIDVQLPCMVNLDGFVLTHAIERMTTLDTQVIRDFVGEHRPLYPLLDVKHPVSHGNMDGPDFYYPHKYQSVIAMQKALGVCEDVFKQFKEISGREYHLVEEYKCDDAEYIAIILGSSFGTMKATVDLLREKGLKVGCAMPRVFRPWPAEALAKVMAGKKGVVVFDKHLSIGAYGPMFPEVTAAASDLDKMPKMYNVIYGLGGADATVAGFEKSFEAVVNGSAEKIHYLGVRL
ncbi:MAG: pyruvate ferredoxin oxidoreductase [Candidatus Methanomethylophilaceae archaeon]|nr:pyruvate ferredoxin oxidoreductase [Candidatus Methanomethylophilaceae archaeon]